jgi:hypothetical protein
MSSLGSNETKQALASSFDDAVRVSKMYLSVAESYVSLYGNDITVGAFLDDLRNVKNLDSVVRDAFLQIAFMQLDGKNGIGHNSPVSMIISLTKKTLKGL